MALVYAAALCTCKKNGVHACVSLPAPSLTLSLHTQSLHPREPPVASIPPAAFSLRRREEARDSWHLSPMYYVVYVARSCCTG